MTELLWENEIRITGFDDPLSPSLLCLKEILKAQALEFFEAGNDVLVPYMMNDALEYYLKFRDAKLTGQFDPDMAVVFAELVQMEDRYLLILGQEDERRCTLAFRDAEEMAQCFSYHTIGHFWIKGQEHLRRLVYIIGTIADKYEYFGECFVNKKEKELIPIIHFAPLREWSPIHEPLEERYPSTKEGIRAMEDLARAAGDRSFLRWVRIYRFFPVRPFTGMLAKLLGSAKRRGLYEMICDRIMEASAPYGIRVYGAAEQERVEALRKEAEDRLKKDGFGGTYPMFHKGELTVLAAEEHPFTIMESDEYVFKIRLMVLNWTKADVMEGIYDLREPFAGR